MTRIPRYRPATDRLAARQLPLRQRLAWQRDTAKLARAFLPVMPIWGVPAPVSSVSPTIHNAACVSSVANPETQAVEGH